VLYLLANVAYLVSLPFETIQTVTSDRVASATAEEVFPGYGAGLMALGILVSIFGCNNGLILTGARAYYAMARDGLFFRAAGELNRHRVPAWGLVIQCVWSCLLILPRTVTVGSDGAVTYGNLYGNLLNYVISAALIFYVLSIAGIFVLRRRRPDIPRPYRALVIRSYRLSTLLAPERLWRSCSSTRQQRPGQDWSSS
jgi:APA family basic amino acid/polyamine antiporter